MELDSTAYRPFRLRAAAPGIVILCPGPYTEGCQRSSVAQADDVQARSPMSETVDPSELTSPPSREKYSLPTQPAGGIPAGASEARCSNRRMPFPASQTKIFGWRYCVVPFIRSD